MLHFLIKKSTQKSVDFKRPFRNIYHHSIPLKIFLLSFMLKTLNYLSCYTAT